MRPVSRWGCGRISTRSGSAGPRTSAGPLVSATPSGIIWRIAGPRRWNVPSVGPDRLESGGHPAGRPGPCRALDPLPGAELRLDVGDVGLHGRQGDIERLGDLG